ncbi:MAG: hypothetical protein NVV83_23085 [Afipia sp.]|nr:hypothetical protein [Afipia sp.]
MSDKAKVIVYGASGYTGKLIAEFLGRADIPFIAAGRSRERLEVEMATVPGLKAGNYEVRAIEHHVDALGPPSRGAPW